MTLTKYYKFVKRVPETCTILVGIHEVIMPANSTNFYDYVSWRLNKLGVPTRDGKIFYGTLEIGVSMIGYSVEWKKKS